MPLKSTVGSVNLELPLKRATECKSDNSIWRVQKAGEQHNEIQSCVPFLLYLSSCKFLLHCFISCTVVCLFGSHPSLLMSGFLSILHFRMELYLHFMPFDCNGSLVGHGSSCKSVCVSHLGGTAALMKTILLPLSSASLTTYRGRKKSLPPLSHTSKQSQMGLVEVLLSSNQQQ